jgi:hypothetical protein
MTLCDYSNGLPHDLREIVDSRSQTPSPPSTPSGSRHKDRHAAIHKATTSTVSAPQMGAMASSGRSSLASPSPPSSPNSRPSIGFSTTKVPQLEDERDDDDDDVSPTSDGPPIVDDLKHMEVVIIYLYLLSVLLLT